MSHPLKIGISQKMRIKTSGMSSLRRRRKGASSNPSSEDKGKDNKNAEKELEENSYGRNVPSFTAAFPLIFVARLVAAAVNPIPDCDESFNYWEPLHFILYGYGSQTWEYDPRYALRSYLYLLFHAAVGFILRLCGVETLFGKPGIFYGIRIALAGLNSLADAAVTSKIGSRFGSSVGWVCLAVMCASAGCFNAGASFLPQTFARDMLSFGFVFEFLEYDRLAILAVGAAGLVGWPFCVIAGAGVGFHILYRRGIFFAAIWGGLSLALLVGVLGIVDSWFYGRGVLAPLNIALYNSRVNEGEKGGTLYGVEPWDFFVKNLFLNFGPLVFLALAAPFLRPISNWLSHSEDTSIEFNEKKKGLMNSQGGYLDLWRIWAPFYVWFALMSSLPHKEERFLYISYPLICVSGSIGFEGIILITSYIITCGSTLWVRTFVRHSLRAIGVVILIVIGVSRSYAMVSYYGAPYSAYNRVSTHFKDLKANGEVLIEQGNVCVGKEWYRFPSHFLLDDLNLRLKFVKSGFGGQLPQPFLEEPLPTATRKLRENFNDLNREEISRYVPIQECNYVVDMKPIGQAISDDEPWWNPQSEFRKLESFYFLDASNSPTLTRAFYIPYLSEKWNQEAEVSIFWRRT